MPNVPADEDDGDGDAPADKDGDDDDGDSTPSQKPPTHVFYYHGLEQDNREERPWFIVGKVLSTCNEKGVEWLQVKDYDCTTHSFTTACLR